MTPLAEHELEACEAGKKILSWHNKQVKDHPQKEKTMRSRSNARSSFLSLPPNCIFRSSKSLLRASKQSVSTSERSIDTFGQ